MRTNTDYVKELQELIRTHDFSSTEEALLYVAKSITLINRVTNYYAIKTSDIIKTSPVILGRETRIAYCGNYGLQYSFKRDDTSDIILLAKCHGRTVIIDDSFEDESKKHILGLIIADIEIIRSIISILLADIRRINISDDTQFIRDILYQGAFKLQVEKGR